VCFVRVIVFFLSIHCVNLIIVVVRDYTIVFKMFFLC
jgi:hypothetical protein